MAALEAVFGAGALGVAIGWVAGMSTTEGTGKRAITVLAGLAGGGGIIGWTQGERQIGLLVAALSIGFLIGLHGGIYLRNEDEGQVVYRRPPRF